MGSSSLGSVRQRSLLLLLWLATLIGVASCGRDTLGPTGARGGTRAGAVQLAPTFPMMRVAGREQPLSIGSIVSFARVRLVLLRANGDTVLNRVVEFPPESASLSLSFPVALDPAAPASGEILAAHLRFVGATGDTVFRGGPVNVVAAPANTPPPTPPEIPLTYTGIGANAASIAITPKTKTVRTGDSLVFTATARDAQGTVLPNTPVAYTSLDTTTVRVGLTSGSATVAGFRGIGTVVAQTVTGQRDTAIVTIAPTPTAITVVAGNNQQVIQRLPFPTPVRVRVDAGDGLPVAGAVIAFTVTAGQGTVSQARDTTDTAGIAEVIWTAGPVAGAASVRAEVVTAPTTLAAVATGTQFASGAATQLRITGPASWTAGVPAVVTVTAYDDYGNVAVGLTNLSTSVLFAGPGLAPIGTAPTMTFVGGGTAPLSNNAALTFTNGTATSTLTLYRRESVTLTATAAPLGSTLSTGTSGSLTLTVQPGPTSSLAVSTPPAGAFDGAAFVTQPAIAALDAFGNSSGEANLAISASVASGPGTLGGTVTAVTAAGTGVATFTDLGLTGVGVHTLRFSTTTGGPSVQSAPFTVQPVGTGIRLHVGASDRTSAVVGTDVTIPVLVDLSNRGGDDLASLTAVVTWDTTMFTYVSSAGGNWTDDAGGSASIFINASRTAGGELALSGFTTQSTTTSFVLRTLTLRPRIAGTTVITAASGAAGNAAGSTVNVTVRPITVLLRP